MDNVYRARLTLYVISATTINGKNFAHNVMAVRIFA